MDNLEEQWKNLREAKLMMRRVKRDLRWLRKMMVVAQQEVCQPKHSYYE